MKSSRRHRNLAPCLFSLLAAAALALTPSPATAEIRLFTPLDHSYTTELTIAVLGMVRDENVLSERGYVEVSVNGDATLEIPLTDGYFFAGEIDLQDGVNNISVEGNMVVVNAGEDETPPAGFRSEFGHNNIEDTCDQCHEPYYGEDGKLESLTLLEDPEVLCNWCHYEVASRRERDKAFIIHSPVRQGNCLGCHLPHAGQEKSLLKTAQDLCRECHAPFLEDIKTKKFVHGPLNVGTCFMCHESHSGCAPALLKEAQGPLCARCHPDILDASQTPGGHHPGVPEGRCHECHTPHASNNQRMMKKIVNNLCVDCHPEKSHNFHEEKGFSIYICGRCHDIHKPDTRYLVINESRALCEQCHDRLGKGDVEHKPFAEQNCFECHGFHQRAFPDHQSETCFRCHPADAIFGAAHPVGIGNDTRCTTCHSPHRAGKRNLGRQVEHGPFAARQCDACHQWLSESTDLPDGGAANEFCFRCHPEKRLPENPDAATIIHKPFAREKCSACHLVHNSDNLYLLSTEVLALCGRCHSFVKKLTSMNFASSHSSVVEGRCGDCHDSHLGSNEKLLRESADNLCRGCHAQVLMLPDGSPFPRQHKPLAEGSCNRCHTAHNSRFPSLLGKQEEVICKQCHAAFVNSFARSTNLSSHKPAVDGNCHECHQVHGSGNDNLLKLAGNGLCLPCHRDRLKGSHHAYTSDYERFREGPLEDEPAFCLDCHNPHASRDKALLRKADAQLCRECHTF